MKIRFELEDLRNFPITMDPEMFGGRPVFRGTRVPIDALWGNLADGLTPDEFVDAFPTVKKEQVAVVLEGTYRLLADAFEAAGAKVSQPA